jgi:hypothetical protein
VSGAEQVAAAGASVRLEERTRPEPTERTWVRTKASYERVGVGASRWARTAAPEKGAGDAGGGAADLAKKSQNPIASMISLPFQNNTSFGIGDYDRTQNVFNIQPVFPVSLGRKWSLVNRTIIPIIHQPDATSSSGAWDGLGDINLTSFVVAPPMGNVMLGLGPIIVFPTATDLNVGDRAWAFGPSAIVVVTPGKWVVGLLASNTFGFEKGGSNLGGAEEERNSFLAQYFVNYNLKHGWFVTSAPIITADWNAPADNRWIVPFGGGVGRVFKIGKQNVNASVQGYYNVVTPDGGPDWSLRLQFTLLFPKK